MSSVFWSNVGAITGIITLFMPVHQAVIELYKLLGAKRRRYWEALAYIVYGPKVRSVRGNPSTAIVDLFSIVPHGLDNVGANVRAQWVAGPQRDLIQGFLLRALGTSPVADVSENDVKNVTEIARMCAPQPIREMSRAFEQMTRTQTTVRTAKANVEGITIEPGFTEPVEEFDGEAWVEPLREFRTQLLTALSREADDTIANSATLDMWEGRFNDRFLRGALRGRRELANALKAAECRYQNALHWWSMVIAVVESAALTWGMTYLIKDLKWQELGFLGLVAFAAMVLGSQGGKSVLDAIIGIGARLKR